MAVDRKALVARFASEVLEGGDPTACDQLLVEDFSFSGNDNASSREEFKEALRSMRRKFPEMSFTLRQALVDGDDGCAIIEIDAVHGGAFLGIEPTGRRFRVTAAYILRFREDRIASATVILDALSVLIQIGAWSPPA
jgi:predicted ester cyclase